MNQETAITRTSKAAIIAYAFYAFAFGGWAYRSDSVLIPIALFASGVLAVASIHSQRYRGYLKVVMGFNSVAAVLLSPVVFLGYIFAGSIIGLVATVFLLVVPNVGLYAYLRQIQAEKDDVSNLTIA